MPVVIINASTKLALPNCSNKTIMMKTCKILLDFINKKVYNEYTNSDKEIYQNYAAQAFEQVHK